MQQIDGLVFGENPAEGLFVDGQFVHRDLRFSFDTPPEWVGRNMTDQVVLSDPSEQAIAVLRLAPHENQPLDIALNRAGIGQLSRTESSTINGLSALTALALVQVQNQERSARIVGIQFDDYIYIFIGATRNADALGAFDAEFRRIAQSFRRLTDADVAAIQARRIKVTRLRAPVSWETLGQASPLNAFAGEQLKVLNASDAAAAEGGVRVKIIE